jgi:putative Mg2+ transporter-C (MgtC) family protein
VLCSAIGLERELRRKSAGLRTNALVGVGACLFMLISKFGFDDVLGRYVTLDPSRVAAQIDSGIGFIGAGLIFVRRDAVRGLTTAAVAWVTAAIGAACGAGLLLLAAAGTAAHFAVVAAYPPLLSRFAGHHGTQTIDVTYADGQGVLRELLRTTLIRGFVVSDIDVHGRDDDRRQVSVRIDISGRGDPAALVATLAELDGVTAVRTNRADDLE